MGSIPNGIANPITAIGPAMPRDVKIDSACFGRVRVMVASG
jgi:hypothetical protein